MNSFEFVFSLFGLLLGFTLVEVLSGFVRATKSWRTHSGQLVEGSSVGWLTPLLAIFVLLDVASYWDNVWQIRELVAVGFDTIFGGLFIAAGYYFAASMVFPDEPHSWPNLDEWFWLHRRQVLGPLLIINSIWVVSYLALGAYSDASITRSIVLQGSYFLSLGVALFSRRASVVGIALGLLSLVYLYSAVDQLVERFG